MIDKHRLQDEKEKEVDRISLSPWEEVVGELVEVKVNEGFVKVIIDTQHIVSSVIEYPEDSSEGGILKEDLQEVGRNQKIGILRTDVESKPLVVRKIETKKGETYE